jgi:DNA-binding PadR family transcriptional regulator
MQARKLYGHELLERMGELGFGGTRPGEIYGTLRLLEGEGLTFSERGKMEYLLSRRRYGLNEDGVAYLELLEHSLELSRTEAERFLLSYEGQPAYGVLR